MSVILICPSLLSPAAPCIDSMRLNLKTLPVGDGPIIARYKKPGSAVVLDSIVTSSPGDIRHALACLPYSTQAASIRLTYGLTSTAHVHINVLETQCPRMRFIVSPQRLS